MEISISDFETCLRDWVVETEPDENRKEHAKKRSETLLKVVGGDCASLMEEWEKMWTRTLKANVANFVLTHGGKAHRRTPSWWEGRRNVSTSGQVQGPTGGPTGGEGTFSIPLGTHGAQRQPPIRVTVTIKLVFKSGQNTTFSLSSVCLRS